MLTRFQRGNVTSNRVSYVSLSEDRNSQFPPKIKSSMMVSRPPQASQSEQRGAFKGGFLERREPNTSASVHIESLEANTSGHL